MFDSNQINLKETLKVLYKVRFINQVDWKTERRKGLKTKNTSAISRIKI